MLNLFFVIVLWLIRVESGRWSLYNVLLALMISDLCQHAWLTRLTIIAKMHVSRVGPHLKALVVMAWKVVGRHAERNQFDLMVPGSISPRLHRLIGSLRFVELDVMKHVRGWEVILFILEPCWFVCLELDPIGCSYFRCLDVQLWLAEPKRVS